MSIFLNSDNRVLIQGITGRDGAFHTKQMIEYGANVVAGVTPGKAGTELHGVPVFNSVKDAVDATNADTSVIYVPAMFAADAIMEAAAHGIKLIIAITEGIPVLDVARAAKFISERGARMIGPNCPGIISPGKSKTGIMPGYIHREGSVGLVSRSGTLTYEVVHLLTEAGLGQSSCIGIGGDPIIGTNFIDCLEAFENDPETKGIVLIGEIGGSDEEEAAAYIKANVSKPVVGFIVGRTAPPGKRMGHAGAIISGSAGTAQDKIAALTTAGVPVADCPSDIVTLLKERLA